MISTKSVKRLSYATCAASLLVSDLIPASCTQAIEPELEGDPGPSSPNPREGMPYPERSSEAIANPIAQPESVVVVETVTQPELTQPELTQPELTQPEPVAVTASIRESFTPTVAPPETLYPVMQSPSQANAAIAEKSAPAVVVPRSPAPQPLAQIPAKPATKAVPASVVVVEHQPSNTLTQPVQPAQTPIAETPTTQVKPVSQKATDLGIQPALIQSNQSVQANQPTQPNSAKAQSNSQSNSQSIQINASQSKADSNSIQTISDQSVDQLLSTQTTLQVSDLQERLETQPQTGQILQNTESNSAKNTNHFVVIDRPVAITQASSITATAIAQTIPTAAPNIPPTILPRATGKFSTNDWIGDSGPFFGAGAFIPLQQKAGNTITFTEGQVVGPTSGGVGANLVVGHRIYDEKSDRIYGGYVGFDHLNTGNANFNQLGVGVETLGKNWDVRANAYLPVGNTRQLTEETVNNSVSAFSNPFFQSNFLAINRTIQQQINRHYEAAATGFDLEAGGKVAKLGENGELRGYGGVYYVNAPGSDGAVGFRTRLEARPSDMVNIGLGLSSDRMFGTSVALSVGVNFPTSTPRQTELKEPFLARLGDSVVRNSNIIVDEQKESIASVIQDTQYINNPATGQPWRFRHAIVGVGTGDGTFENPTGTVADALAVAQPNDIVYVQPGTNPGIPAFTIPDSVQVLSTGPNQFINTTELGNIQLPLSGAGVLPNVTGTVTMGNNTTLSGFAIATATGPGILGSNISQITVRDNAISNTAGAGVQLNNVQGQVQVFDNTIQQAQADGFALNNNQGQVDLLLTRNQITNNGGGSVDGDGVNVTLRNGATGNFTVTNNTIANNTNAGGIANGVDVKLFDSSNGNFTMTDNAITGNQLNGIVIDQESTAQGTFNIARNNLSGNGLNGFEALLSDNAQGQYNLDANTISNNQQRGVQVIAAEQAQATLNLTNSTVTGNQDDGVFLQSSDQSRLNATVLNTTIANNSNYGLLTNATGTSQFRILAGSNTITGNGLPGVSINTADTANTAASLQSNTITGNAFSDLDVFNTSAGATACLQPLNNTVGNLILDDFFGGPLSVEAGALPTNSVTTSTTFWSGTTVPAGTCGF